MFFFSLSIVLQLNSTIEKIEGALATKIPDDTPLSIYQTIRHRTDIWILLGENGI